MQEEQEVSSQSTIIPLERIEKYRHLLNLTQHHRHKQEQYENTQQQNIETLLPLKQLAINPIHSSTETLKSTNNLLELRHCLEHKPKTVHSAYSSESLIKLIRSIQSNPSEFQQIHAINTTLSQQNKKEFIIDKILREYCEFSYEELLEHLHYIRHELRDKEMYREMLEWMKSMLVKIKYLLYKNCEVLVSVLGECVNFYLRRTEYQYKETETEGYEYSVVIGLDKLAVSFCSSNEYCENIMHVLVNKLREYCMVDGYDLEQGDFVMENILTGQSNSMGGSNVFEINDIPECVLEAYERKQLVIEERISSITENNTINPEVFYTQLIANTFIKYAEDTFYLIEGTIVFLSNLVLEKKQLKSIAYDQQFISMKHPLEQEKVIQETFMNLYCEHFEGLPEEMYKNGEKCPYCSEPIIVDEIKCFERNKNLFQNLLKRNYLNPNGDNVIYYFKDKIFSLATKEKYSSYAHFCQFIKKHCFLRDRPDPVMLLEIERITLYSKLWGKKKLFTSDEMITTPVRGKYCRHLEFFELMRVYEKYLERKEDETSFECFLCFEPIEFDEIIYLHEIKLLIDLAKYNFYPTNGCLLNTYIEVSHEHETVELCCELEKGYMKRTYELPIYQTLVDPLTKSEKGLVEEKSNKKEEEGEFEYTEEFSYFYFGF